MSDMYQLGSTPIGKEQGIIDRLFEKQDIELLKLIRNDETLRDLENSIFINQSSILQEKNSSHSSKSGKSQEAQRKAHRSERPV